MGNPHQNAFLFDDEDDESGAQGQEVAALGDAFESWLASQRASGKLRQPSSIQLYKSIWKSFHAWCLGESPKVTLASLDFADLAKFQQTCNGVNKNRDIKSSARPSHLTLVPLSGDGADFAPVLPGRGYPDLPEPGALQAPPADSHTPITHRHALRLFRLIDNVAHHHARTTGGHYNRAAADWIASNPEVRFAEASFKDPMPEHLTSAQAAHLIAFLTRARPRLLHSGELRPGHDDTPMQWQQVRNRVSVALQLGAGLTPGDIRVLTLKSPIFRVGEEHLPGARPIQLSIDANGSSPSRESPLAPWAGELLAYWLLARRNAGIQGDYLFPSVRAGKPWGKEAQYKGANLVLQEGSLPSHTDQAPTGSFQLRHTFALRQLRRGAKEADVARWLGIDVEGMAKYRRVAMSEEDVV